MQSPPGPEGLELCDGEQDQNYEGTRQGREQGRGRAHAPVPQGRAAVAPVTVICAVFT